MVLMPGVEHIGVSRRLTLNLRKSGSCNVSKPFCLLVMGCILRTLSAGASLQDLQAELRFLLTRWRQFQCACPAGPRTVP